MSRRGMSVAAQSGSASLEYAVRSAFVGGLTSTMWVSAAICLLGAAMVARYLPDSRAVAAESGDAVDVSARDRG